MCKTAVCACVCMCVRDVRWDACGVEGVYTGYPRMCKVRLWVLFLSVQISLTVVILLLK